MAAWLHTSFRIAHRDAEYLKGELVDKVAGSATAASLRGGKFSARRIINGIKLLLGGLALGVHRGGLWIAVVNDAGTYSAGNIACVQANAAGDTITFTFGTLTIVLTEGATGLEGFARGADNTACALNLANCINAHPILSGLVLAAPSVGNCALTSKVNGPLLHLMAMSTSDGTAFSFTQLTGTTMGTAALFPQHVLGSKNP